MKSIPARQTAQEALMVMREAFRDQAGVGVDPAGELVYVNPDRPDKAAADRASPDDVRKVLAAKIENELARSHTSIEQLRNHIRKNLPSLERVDLAPGNPAIPLLVCEWEALLRQTDPKRSIAFEADKRAMARREKLVDFLRGCLPGGGDLTPLGSNQYEATIHPSTEQQAQMLEDFEHNAYRAIDASLNITKQLVKDSPRSNDLQILMPGRRDAKREVIALRHAPEQAAAAALRALTRSRHLRATGAGEPSHVSKPQDPLESSDRNFMQVLSMMTDQTLLNHLDSLQADMLGNHQLIFSRDDDQRRRQLLIDNDGNPVLAIAEEKLSRSFVAMDIGIQPFPLKSPPLGTPMSNDTATFSFRAAVTLRKEDAEQGRLRARFIGTPELNLRFALDWERIDPILAKLWP